LEHDLGVDSEDRTVARLLGDAPRLPLCMVAHDLRRVGELGRGRFRVVRLDNLERNAELLQDRTTLG
jgi:hypothetical protein